MKSQKKLGFYRKSYGSNKRLIKIFEINQKIRYESSDNDWKDKNFVKNLQKEEKKSRKEIRLMLKEGKIRTADDFYRAAWFFHHDNNFSSYALAVALASASKHLGEIWGKNLYAMALDRFLLAIKQVQYFGTQFEKRRGKWKISPFNKKTEDKERKEYLVEPIKKYFEILKDSKSGKSKKIKS